MSLETTFIFEPDEEEALTFAKQEGDGRTLVSRLVPYGLEPKAPHKDRVRFLPTSFDNTIKGKRQTQIPVYRFHEQDHKSQWVGTSTTVQSDGNWLMGEARIARNTAGNDLLNEIEDGFFGSVSISGRPLRSRLAKDGVHEIQEFMLDHWAFLPVGTQAFDDAELVLQHELQEAEWDDGVRREAPPETMSLAEAQAIATDLRKRTRLF